MIIYKTCMRFTCSRTNEETGPQIKVCLWKSHRDSLSIIVNHMVTDGQGIKQCAYLLADIYSKIIRNKEYVPDYIIDGDRGFKKIISGIPFMDKVKILLFNKKENNQSNNHKFPLCSEEEKSPLILTHEISSEMYDAIRNFCKNNKVTVNDVILTAYFRVVSNMLQLRGQTLSVPIMIDMRRYLEDKSFYTLTNFTSTAAISIAVNPGEDFCKTLGKVKLDINSKKNNHLGMNGFLKLDMLFGILKDNLSYKILKKSLKNPKISMTNIGVLDSNKLVFEGCNIENAFVTGSIKRYPCFQLSVSSFKNKMTFCVNLYGSQQDYDIISSFFNNMDNELKEIPSISVIKNNSAI
ncbi:MAG: hypothetical protein Q8936_13255 [Bacillota bacterium]|nr:hypothetical protein [Bacillota bacterium]